VSSVFPRLAWHDELLALHSRVSRGPYVDTWDGVTVQAPKRHQREHITATIVLYYTCSGGVPTGANVWAAIDDLEDLYRSGESGNLADKKFDFMKSELTVKDAIDIGTKIKLQPPKPGRSKELERAPHKLDSNDSGNAV